MSALWVENLKDERMKNIVQIATNVAPRKATVLILVKVELARNS